MRHLRSADKQGPVNRRFGKNLRRIRRDRGLSQEALADLSGIRRTEASLLEREKGRLGEGGPFPLRGVVPYLAIQGGFLPVDIWPLKLEIRTEKKSTIDSVESWYTLAPF
jgi:transcriptional regulator with XRE-family HTH domain